MDLRPIGVFDSGLGGLTVVKEIKKILPKESIVYLGDTARIPYGTRSKKAVQRFTFQDAQYLLTKNVKCIVIACNTSSAQAGTYLRKKIETPVLDVITSGVGSVTSGVGGRRIAIIATQGTFSSHAYKKGINRVKKRNSVYEVACPLFVSFIEEGEIKGGLLAALAKRYLHNVNKFKPDVLILGCTHYPIIRKIIAKNLDSNVEIIDSGKEVAKDLKKFLKKNNLYSKSDLSPKYTYYVTDKNQNFEKVADMFLDEKIGKNIVQVEPF